MNVLWIFFFLLNILFYSVLFLSFLFYFLEGFFFKKKKGFEIFHYFFQTFLYTKLVHCQNKGREEKLD